jgi:LacI family repressor for deo operon, udp, cdd, tsx, nupC, and nupG
MSQKAARIADVARVAGVSTATVSRALSNPDLLTEETRKAVFDAIRDTGYRVNRAARNLRKQRAGAVLVLVPNLGNPFFSHILAGINAGFSGSEYSVLIADTTQMENTAEGLVSYFLDGRIDGVISLDGTLSPDDLAHFAALGIEDKIVFACEWVQDANFPSIRSDNVAGARLAVRHLNQLGHKDIAHVTGPAGNVLTQARRDAMMAERENLDLSARPDWIIRGDFSLRSGHDAARQILQMSDRPTAVFCASDMVAFGLIAGLEQGGLSVPSDISVIGFDDIELAEFYTPGLTTIRQYRRSLGEGAAEMLLACLGPEAGPKNNVETLGVELIIRGSTQAI